MLRGCYDRMLTKNAMDAKDLRLGHIPIVEFYVHESEVKMACDQGFASSCEMGTNKWLKVSCVNADLQDTLQKHSSLYRHCGIL